DLLTDEDARGAIRERLKRDMKENNGPKPDEVKFGQVAPPREYRVTLVAGVGGSSDVSLSCPTPLSKGVVENGGDVTFRLLPLDEDLVTELKPEQIHLRVEATIRARFERQQMSVNLVTIQESLQTFANKLGSRSAKGGPTEALVYVPGGKASGST